MILLAQAGLGGAAAAAGAVFSILGLLIGLTPLFLLMLWYLPEILQFVVDTIRGRDLLAESERDRLLDGRILSRTDEW